MAEERATPWCTTAGVEKPQALYSARSWRVRGVLAKVGHCCDGLRVCLREESSLWTVILITAALQAAVLYLGAGSLRDRGDLALQMVSGPVAELVNSAVERCIDRVGYEPHWLSRDAKDIVAAASMLAQAANVLRAGWSVFWGPS